MEDRLTLSIKESAVAVGLSPWTIRKYIREGTLHPIRIGRRVLVEPAELRRLVEAGRVCESGGPSRAVAA
jgi:excisionase family DNA binding protein